MKRLLPFAILCAFLSPAVFAGRQRAVALIPRLQRFGEPLPGLPASLIERFEAGKVRFEQPDRFNALSEADRAKLLAFLKSL